MADKFIVWDATNGRYKEREATAVSAGIGDAGKVVALAASGKLDPSVLPTDLVVHEDLLFTYDIDGVLTDVDGETKYLEFAYNLDGQLETVTNTVSGEVRTLAYDIDGLLESVTVTP